MIDKLLREAPTAAAIPTPSPAKIYLEEELDKLPDEERGSAKEESELIS